MRSLRYVNIYLLSQTENDNYDTYDSCVVLAESEDEAKLIHPYGHYKYRKEVNGWISDKWYNKIVDNSFPLSLIRNYTSDDWCNSPEVVVVKYIGEFKGNIEEYPTRIVCASFNAG